MAMVPGGSVNGLSDVRTSKDASELLRKVLRVWYEFSGASVQGSESKSKAVPVSSKFEEPNSGTQALGGLMSD